MTDKDSNSDWIRKNENNRQRLLLNKDEPYPYLMPYYWLVKLKDRVSKLDPDVAKHFSMGTDKEKSSLVVKSSVTEAKRKRAIWVIMHPYLYKIEQWLKRLFK